MSERYRALSFSPSCDVAALMSLSCGLQNFRLPFLHHSINSDEDFAQNPNLSQWKLDALTTLKELQAFLVETDLACLTQEAFASVVAITVPLTNDVNLITEPMQAIAEGIMTKLPNLTVDVISCVLSQQIRPWFCNTPHSLINPVSGRRLPRAAGGPSAAMDMYEDQVWKTLPGLASLLLWCIQHLKIEDYEQVWHLVVPPTMIFLDDYESFYKLKGLIVVSELVKHVPPDTLKRTGVDGLLVSSLKTAMTHLHSPLSPEILRRSIPLLIKVIDLTTPVDSKLRFDQLSAVLGDGIIGGVWIYASTELDTLEASMIVLPDVLQALGIGSVRYLKALVSQLVHHLTSLPSQRRGFLQLTSLEVLEVLISICRPRISGWTGLIVEGLANSWVSLRDEGLNEQNHQQLASALRRVASILSQVCPSVTDNEYRLLLACDEAMFRGLLVTETNVKYKP